MNRVLAIGAKGEDVARLQARLKVLGYDPGPSDGIFGEKTRQAVLLWEQEYYSDGQVGPDEWVAIQGNVEPTKGAGINPPLLRGEAALIKMFGEPWLDVDVWRVKHLRPVDVPKEPFAHILKRGVIWANGYMAVPLRKAMVTIAEAGLASKLKTFDGCFNVRLIRGSTSKWSTHTWGIAVDFNAATNPLGAVPSLHPGIVAAFQTEGFMWGGDFPRKDGMHFQYVESI